MDSKLKYTLTTSLIAVASLPIVTNMLKKQDTSSKDSVEQLVELIQSHDLLQRNAYVNGDSHGTIYSIKHPSNHGNPNVELDFIWYLDTTNNGVTKGDIITYQLQSYDSNRIHTIEINEIIDSQITGINQTTNSQLTPPEIEKFRAEIIDLLRLFFNILKNNN